MRKDYKKIKMKEGKLMSNLEMENSNNIKTDNSVENNINNNLEKNNDQKSFIETKFGNVINKGFNVGLRFLLPDVVEDQFIEIKDSILKSGFKEGIKKAIESSIDLGKSALGIVTGKFENVKQVQNAIKKRRNNR